MVEAGSLLGKSAIITGGASGIGAACVRAFVAAGASVTLTDLNEEGGQAVADECGAEFLHHDVVDETRWRDVVDAHLDRSGRLDALVNSAGISRQASIEDCSLAEWRKVIDVNLTGVMIGCREAVRAMKANPGGPSGSIINVASLAAFFGLPTGISYNAAKGGVRFLTKSVAVHCARQYRTIRCNAVHPGTTDTQMITAGLGAEGDPEAARARLEARQPTGRIARGDEIAACILFLASDAASYVTGADLVIDGGRLAALSG